MADVIEIGPHRLLVGGASLTTVQAVLGPREADLVYTDPPWGPQALHMFDTMNKSDYQEWADFLVNFGQAVDYAAKGPVLVYMGTPFIGDIADALSRYDIHELGRWELEYGSPVWWQSLGAKKRLSATLWYGHRDPSMLGPLGLGMPAVHGAKAVEFVMKALGIKAGMVMHDPCVGLGLVAKVAAKHGCIFKGSDLNATRLGSTADLLRKMVK